MVGFDLRPGKEGPPPNYRFVRGDVLQGLSFGRDRFDLVHQSLLTPGIPLDLWATVLGELVRVAGRLR